jgi:hypothetical protein
MSVLDWFGLGLLLVWHKMHWQQARGNCKIKVMAHNVWQIKTSLINTKSRWISGKFRENLDNLSHLIKVKFLWYRGIKYNIFRLIPKTSYVTQTLNIKYRGTIEPRAIWFFLYYKKNHLTIEYEFLWTFKKRGRIKNHGKYINVRFRLIRTWSSVSLRKWPSLVLFILVDWIIVSGFISSGHYFRMIWFVSFKTAL